MLEPELAESLVATWADRVNIHNDLCQQFDPDVPVCTCGVPRLFEDLVDALRLRGLAEAMFTRGDLLAPAPVSQG